MKNYEAMSDEDLNFEVACHSFDAGWLDRHYGKEGVVPDYCGSDSDAGPVIDENKIGTEFIDGFGWTATAPFASTITASCYDSRRRAAMIVFLMMKDAEK